MRRVINELRVVWTFHKVALGGALIVVVLAVVMAIVVTFVSAPQSTKGTVISFDVAGSERRNAPAAIVHVEGRLARIKVYRRISCLVGEEMELMRYDTPLGSFYTLASGPRPCHSPEG